MHNPPEKVCVRGNTETDTDIKTRTYMDCKLLV